MKNKLTDRYLRSVKPTGVRFEIIDEAVPILRLRVGEKGAMTWSIQTRIAGRKRRFTIGPYPAIGLSDARSRAQQMLIDVKDGHDPVAEARRSRQADQLSVIEAIDLYHQGRLVNLKTGHIVKRDLVAHLKPLLRRPVDEISVADIARLIDQKAATAPVMANRLIAAIRPFWAWMATRGYCPENVAASIKKPAPETARDRVLSQIEVAAIWVAASKMPYPFGPLFQLLVLTGQRRTEVSDMRWSEIHLGNSEWVLPAERTKTGKAHIVHLTKPAIEILRSVPFHLRSDLVFTTNGRTPVSGFSKAKARLDELSGVENWRLHDLRRSFASQCADLGIDSAAADRVLNHVAAGAMGVVQRTYQRSAMLDQRREALEAWADWVLDGVAGSDVNVGRAE
jgi:integrase